MPKQPASKQYLDSLYERRPISICTVSISGQEHRHMDWVTRILAKGIETGKGGWYSRKTGYHLGIQVACTSYIEEYIKP
jgi:hypothetical protein